MLPHTTSAVSAFPEDDDGRPTPFASKTGVGTTGLFLCSNDILILYKYHLRDVWLCPLTDGHL